MRWYQSFWRYLKSYFTVVGFVVTLMTLVSFTLFTVLIVKGPASSKAASATPLSEQSILHVKLAGQLELDQPRMEAYFEELFGEVEIFHLSEFRHILRKAAHDERITGMRLEIGNVYGGRAAYVALHRLLQEFAATKTIDVIMNGGDDWQYLLASTGQYITLTPASGMMIPGPVFNLIYFGDGLRKLGIDLEVVKAGRYKSAFEPFVANRPSEATLEQYRAMEAHLRSYLVGEVASGRGQPLAKVESWFAQSIFNSEDALAQGLVDFVGHVNTMESVPQVLQAFRKDKLIDYFDYKSHAGAVKDPLEEASGSAGIGLIEAKGEISMFDASGESLIPEYVTKRVKWAMENEDVKSVVLKIDSPGGSALASEIMWNELKRLADAKPLVVSMGNVAASGGYYIAAPAKTIFAEPTTITGSIGVISMVPNFESFNEKYGVSFHVVTQSERAKLLDPGAKSTGLDKQLLESMTEEVYQTFKSRVAAGRGLSLEKVQELAQGRVYTGSEALTLNLVDKLGGLTEAFNEAKRLGGLEENKLYPVMTYHGDGLDFRECLKRPSKMLRCLKQIDSKLRAKGPIGVEKRLAYAKARFEAWMSMAKRGEALALWPGYVALGI